MLPVAIVDKLTDPLPDPPVIPFLLRILVLDELQALLQNFPNRFYRGDLPEPVLDHIGVIIVGGTIRRGDLLITICTRKGQPLLMNLNRYNLPLPISEISRIVPVGPGPFSLFPLPRGECLG